MTNCPCGSNQSYAECCGRFHNGEVTAGSAEALMRSRYSAYVLKLSAYLAETWHPSTRPVNLDLTADTTAWQGLEIIACEGGRGDSLEGYVEFVAHYAGGQLHERSRFVREEGRWFYVDGEILPPVAAAKVGRNEPCPCGSGHKYKRCCG